MHETNNTNQILVVDDEIISRLVLSKMIETQGFVVETANNGKEALAMWQKKRYSLIFTDCRMPVMDGFGLTEAIRRIEEAEQSPKSHIIALTANESEAERNRCKQAGMNDCFTKPMTSDQLRTILANCFEMKTVKTGPVSPIIDYSILEDIFPDKLKQATVLKDFQIHLRENHDALKLQLEKSNLDNIERIAHQMKGACKMVGVNSIAIIYAKIEIMAKNGRVADPLTLSSLNSRIQQFNSHLLQQSNAVNLALAVTENK